MPSRYIASSMAVPDSVALSAAQIHSPSTTSAAVMGACMMPSQVRWTLRRENAEYSASKVALFMALKHSMPPARKLM